MSTVDALTDRAMVVLQDRPVVAMSPWLAGAARECAGTGRVLEIVTPAASRLSPALRAAAGGTPGAPGSPDAGVHWVVRDGDGYYEGLTGRPLHWDGGAFAPVPDARDYAPGFTGRPEAPIGAQLSLVHRVRHASGGDLGGPTDRLLQLLTGKQPAGWGPAEPLEHQWRPEMFAEHVRRERTARVLVIGDGPRPAQAICSFTAADGGALDETTTVVIGYAPADPPPLQHLPSLVAALAADQPVASLFVQLTPGRADLTTEPRWTGAPAAVALAVAGAAAGPAGIPAQQVGPQRAPMTLFTLGDGRSPDGWQRHRALLAHLRH
ncbi:DUF6177 family protein [Actinomadura parmotrematis]|uniref:Uncharacterized protein n=1 Tax=Actinomadura parmotrematis TaxID=2864039 RepID=A0ABS7FXZ8_9ACTN|nr:DUF6177 family protein [Actinomadura parmotrematis]MBW8485297.1 hypothetical protein [Actinomadura parmotrematis]